MEGGGLRLKCQIDKSRTLKKHHIFEKYPNQFAANNLGAVGGNDFAAINIIPYSKQIMS
jgi:hypothetical protein